MMRRVSRLNRYILGQLAGPFAFFVLALTGVVWITQSLRFVDLIINKGLPPGPFFYMILLILPGVLTIILPVALFAAVLYTYYRLGADSELVVMSSAGISLPSVARPALLAAGILTLVSYLLTLYLMPAGYREFRGMKTELRSNLSYVLLQEGSFNAIGGRLTVYVRERGSNGDLHGILVHDNRDLRRPVTMMAEHGALVRTSEGPRFVLANGNRQQIDQASDQLSMLYFDKYTLDLSQFVSSPDDRWYESSERYLGELLFPGDTRDDIRNADRFLAEAHDRLVSPLYCLVFTLIALAGIFGGEFNRRGYGWRIVIAIAAATFVRLSGVAFVNLAAKTPLTTPLIYLNVMIAIGASLYLLSRRTGVQLRPVFRQSATT